MHLIPLRLSLPGHQYKLFSGYSEESLLCTDALYIGLDRTLMQKRNGSRLCTEEEKKLQYHCKRNTRKDMILGCKIRVWTDHTAIQNQFKHKNLRGRLTRLFVTLQDYEVTFEYYQVKRIPQLMRSPEIFRQNQI